MRRRHGQGHRGWAAAFAFVALAALAASAATLTSGGEGAVTGGGWSWVPPWAWSWWGGGAMDGAPSAGVEAPIADDEAGDRAAVNALVTTAPAATRLVLATDGAPLTLFAAREAAQPLAVLAGGARQEGSVAGNAEVRLVATGEPGPWNVALDAAGPWQIEIAAGAESLRLDLADLALRSLRVGAPTAGLQATLPRSGRHEVMLGDGRTALLVPRGSSLDARLELGRGATVVQVEPDARGRLDLVPGSGPTTVVVDASITVALSLPPGDPPALALEGTWWRYLHDEGVTWVRSPLATPPEQAELALVVTAAASAPLAVTYR